MASGNSLLTFTVQANQPPASTYATLDTRNAQLVLEFDAAADEAAIFAGVMPRAYAGGGLTCNICWCADSATTGDVIWGISLERNQDETDTVASDSFATERTVTSAAPGTAGLVQYASIAFTNGAQMDSIAVGERFRMKLRRVGSNGSDTMSGDAQALTVEVIET